MEMALGAAETSAAVEKCVAVDLGAGTGRLVAGWIADDRWKLEEVGRFRTPSGLDPETGYQCWDLDQISNELQSKLLQASSTGQLISVGVDSWGVDYILLDEKLRQVGVPVCYRDRRTAGLMQRLHDRVPADEIYRRTGIQFQPFNTLYQLAACAEQRPDWIRAAKHFLMIPDFLHFGLSGIVSNEYTNSTTTQMCGLDGQWDSVLIDAVELDRSLLQTPIPAGTILGDGTGVARGLKVIAPATHDTASAVAGTPLQREDEAYISSGTWSLMGIETMVPITSHEAMVMNFTNEGGLERRFRLLKNIMGMWPIQRVCDEQKVFDFGALVKDASEVEPWRFIIDVNDSEFLNPQSMTQSIQNYCRNSGQPAPDSAVQLARCVFDSLALSYRHVMHQIETVAQRTISKIRIVGGGCQNQPLNQLCADACNITVVAGPIEASALGNISAQMIALGILPDLSSARALISTSFEMHEYEPRTRVPHRALELFDELLATTKVKGGVSA